MITELIAFWMRIVFDSTALADQDFKLAVSIQQCEIFWNKYIGPKSVDNLNAKKYADFI